MILPRITPCLLIKDDALYKTVKFRDLNYIGDPINAVRIFNEKLVDELTIFDIGVSAKNQKPNFDLISIIASECRMPLCYGGGIENVSQIREIVSLGVEKVSVNTSALKNSKILVEGCKEIGNQSMVLTLDIMKENNNYFIYTRNGTSNTGLCPFDFIKKNQEHVGEIIVNNINNDGTMIGYDYELIDKIKSIITIPLTVIGGAGSLEDIKSLFKRYGIIGASAGSLFVYKGSYKAVLINYPAKEIKHNLYSIL